MKKPTIISQWKRGTRGLKSLTWI